MGFKRRLASHSRRRLKILVALYLLQGEHTTFLLEVCKYICQCFAETFTNLFRKYKKEQIDFLENL